MGHPPGGVLRVLVELLDVVECSTSALEEHLGSHGPDAVDARELPQDVVPLVFEGSRCDVFVGCQPKSQ